VAATPGQPSQAGHGTLAPLKWHGSSRDGYFDVFIVTVEGATSFSGIYKNNIPFTDGVADINLGTGPGWPADWTAADVE
jgi:hypothetical protein